MRSSESSVAAALMSRAAVACTSWASARQNSAEVMLRCSLPWPRWPFGEPPWSCQPPTKGLHGPWACCASVRPTSWAALVASTCARATCTSAKPLSSIRQAEKFKRSVLGFWSLPNPALRSLHSTKPTTPESLPACYGRHAVCCEEVPKSRMSPSAGSIRNHATQQGFCSLPSLLRALVVGSASVGMLPPVSEQQPSTPARI